MLIYIHIFLTAKGLQIPKRQSETVKRRTNNTMVKSKGQTLIYETLQRKLKIEHHDHTKGRQ